MEDGGGGVEGGRLEIEVGLEGEGGMGWWWKLEGEESLSGRGKGVWNV